MNLIEEIKELSNKWKYEIINDDPYNSEDYNNGYNSCLWNCGEELETLIYKALADEVLTKL